MVERSHKCTYNVVVYLLTNVLLFVANPATLHSPLKKGALLLTTMKTKIYENLQNIIPAKCLNMNH